MNEYKETERTCPACKSINIRSNGSDWFCKDCGKYFKKRVKMNPRGRVKGCITWSKGLTKESDFRVAEFSISLSKTKKRLISEGKLDSTPNLPPVKIYITKEELEELHSIMDQEDMAKTLEISQSRVCQLLKKYDIEPHSHAAVQPHIPTQDERKRTSDRMMGNTNWRLSHEFPNKEEQKMIKFFSKWNLPFKYVGDGSFRIDGKCPDFIDEEKKLIIEFFGNLWHIDSDEPKRIKFFEERGWRCLVIWGSQVMGNSRGNNRTLKWEEPLYNKILRWMSGI
jgi:hypothetical protein